MFKRVFWGWHRGCGGVWWEGTPWLHSEPFDAAVSRAVPCRSRWDRPHRGLWEGGGGTFGALNQSKATAPRIEVALGGKRFPDPGRPVSDSVVVFVL